MELEETEDKLQAASEDSVSALLAVLKLKLPSHPILNHLGRQLAQVVAIYASWTDFNHVPFHQPSINHNVFFKSVHFYCNVPMQVQVMASGLALSMAEAKHPKGGHSIDDPEPLFRGIFRQLMLDYRVLPALAGLASEPPVGVRDPALAREIQLVTSAAISRLVAQPAVKCDNVASLKNAQLY